jgi:hypothetical protein
MSRRRVMALFRRVVEEIRRDRPSLGLLFIAPVLVTGLVTFILREGQTSSVDAVIVNQAGAPGEVVAGLLTSALREQGATVRAAGDEPAARELVIDGSSSVAIVIPPGLGASGTAPIRLVTNGLDPAGEANQIGAI